MRTIVNNRSMQQVRYWRNTETLFSHAIEATPNNDRAYYNLGSYYFDHGRTKEAIQCYRKALQIRPKYEDALNNLGVLYLVTQRHEQAVASFEQCIRVAPGFDQAYLNLARVYALEGARDKARGVLLDLLKQHPDHAPAKQMLDQLGQ